ncbi:DUF1800 family protein [Kineococcus sp. R8]|nr:DUF1800 family protein [Kineococcus siccus]
MHLLRRATYGPTPESRAEIARLGTRGWLDAQLNPGAIDDRAVDEFVRRFPGYQRSAEDVYRGGYPAVEWNLMFDVGRLTLARQIWSRRQLFEVVVDVFNNLLHVACPSSDVWASRQDYDRTVIRRHAFGSFADMLVDSARNPAMLSFLDNTSSRAGAPNENYARELLELHTVGVDAGFTEADVKTGARLLTGLRISDSGASVFDPARHDGGGGTVFGFGYPAHAPADGFRWIEAYLRWLAVHPATAARVSRRLAVRFVSDDPPASLVDRMAQVWRSTGAQVVPVLRVLFTSPEFAASAGAKVRTPQEDFVATLRTLGTGMEPAGTAGIVKLFWHALDAGHAPMAWGAPNGYPDVAAAWASPSGTLLRWNRHMDFAGGWYPKELRFVPATQLLDAVPSTWGGLVDALALRLIGSPLGAEERAALLQYTGRGAGTPLGPGDRWVQENLQYLVALVLDSPTFCTR